MKKPTKLLFLSTALFAMLTLASCNKPQDSTGATKADSTMGAEVKDVEVTAKVKTSLHCFMLNTSNNFFMMDPLV